MHLSLTWVLVFTFLVFQDVKRDLAYVAPFASAEVLSAKLKEFGYPVEARILDLGAGTGLTGEALHKLGHGNIDAVDMSPEVLEVAKGKGVYQNLITGFMASENSKDLGVASNQYDAAICVGVFTQGHVKGKGLNDFIHAVKPGGLACFTIRDDVINDPKYGYDEKIKELCRENKWKLVNKSHIPYRSAENLQGWLHVYQVLR